MATTKRTTKTTKKTATKRAKKATAKKKAPAKKAAASKRTTAAKAAKKAPATRATKRTTKVEVEPERAPAASPSTPERVDIPPGARRSIFFDVENTSRAGDIVNVLEHLDVDFARSPTEFLAVGNWRVIGHDPARLLAGQGASLVHSAPSTGVRDWSDLRIAVAAGVWLASAVPGDLIEIVSDDQAFDAVGDVAAGRGVTFRRLSYRSLAGLGESAPAPAPAPTSTSRPRRRRRGGRRNGRRRTDAAVDDRDERDDRDNRAEPKTKPVAPPAPDAEGATAPVDEVRDVVRDLVAAAPDGVTLDDVANGLRARGFTRPPGSSRLITRLKLIKDVEVGRDGKIRMPNETGSSAASSEAPDEGDGAAKGKRRRRRGGRGRRGGRKTSGATTS